MDFDEIRRYDILKKTGEFNPNDEVKRYDIQKRTGNSNQKGTLRKGGLISERVFSLWSNPQKNVQYIAIIIHKLGHTQ